MTIGELKELLQRYLTGKATDDDLRVVERWFVRTEGKGYSMTEEKREEVAARLLPRLRAITYQDKGRVFVFSRRLRRIAAIFFIVLGSAILYRYRYAILDRIDPIPQQTVMAGLYEIRSVVLPDSSRAVLKSGSRISYPVRYRGDSRRVSMEGSVFFDIHKDPSSVFTVHSEQVDVRVLGTSFIVSDSQKAASAVVQVLSGRVGIVHGRQDLGELGAGKELVYDQGTALRQDIDSLQAVAWVHKTFSFNETPLQSVFAAIQDRFGVRFVIRKKQAAVKLFTGMFSETDSLKDILLALSLSTGIRYSTIDKTTIAVNYP